MNAETLAETLKVDNTNGIHLCTCNNCDAILIDENPQTGATKYDVPSEAIAMEYLKDEGDTHYWGCPNCLTDGFLSDL